MKKQPVIFDCDGVLLDWESGFRKWAEATYQHLAFRSPFPDSWDLSGWIGCSSDEASDLIRRFNASPEFAHLNPMPDAARILYELDRAGHPIYALTSCSAAPTVQQRRRENLACLFSTEFQSVICLDLGVSKQPMLSSFWDILGQCIWVEDNFKNAMSGVETGHRSFFLHRPHNKTHWDQEPQRLNHLDRLSDLVSLIK